MEELRMSSEEHQVRFCIDGFLLYKDLRKWFIWFQLSNNDAGAIDTSSRCDIVSLTAGVDRLTLSSVGALYSDASGLQTSFSGFNLDTAMNNVAAFCVGRLVKELHNCFV